MGYTLTPLMHACFLAMLFDAKLKLKFEKED